ncbi:AarF/ABC1/UbiB kinase family protein [Alteromonas sediminis]|uniref:AarF/ABC1/UbiB kinase family protein n=1 Tax=Alteromonas sediminis TaxID=2259342 RepID=A0A3N5YMP2_9ALTE|nr:AarF/ABC1/UbiB kinase family protein [Alteromonas sediminis]RPJ66731.1 AarF/ABC1/UbiB kinase family protein [Alteromonas sediminis]
MPDKQRKSRAVPTSRISRFSRLGSLAATVTGSVLSGGAKTLLRGERPKLTDLVLTPANIERIADQLASMRGAAMKIGQLISIDDGEFLPPELATILARLRDDADPMPKGQLQQVLDSAWGEGWHDKLLYFSYAPIAAASIGQVHKAILMDGTMLAIKVQYPGIKKSINSDVDNVAGLIKLIGIIPESANIQPLLNEAKVQLHAEANYQTEANMLKRYAACIDGLVDYQCPTIVEEWTTETVLAMTFQKGEPITALEQSSQALKNKMMTSLFALFFKEIFEFNLIQTDPNLANYLVDIEDGYWVLLDFGATRDFPASLSHAYLALIHAAHRQNDDALLQAAMQIGLVDSTATEAQLSIILSMLKIACEPLHSKGGHNFANNDAAQRLQELGWTLSMEEAFWQAPPADAAFMHRKLGGLYLLAKRLGATVDLHALLTPYLADT